MTTERFFTFKVRPPLKVLIIADREADAEFVASALDYDASPSNPKSFQVKRIRSGQLGNLDKGSALETYACVFLLGVRQLSEIDWGALNGYVHNGGGLVVGLGNPCDASNYNGEIAAQFLPAQLGERKTPRPETVIGKVTDVTHPLFSRYGKEFDTQLAQVPVYQYWTIKASRHSRWTGPARSCLMPTAHPH